MRRLRLLVAHTWLWLRHDLHDFDLRQEPESQRRVRQWFLRGIRRMEYDPRTQWRYHLIMSWWWLANFPLIVVLYFVLPEVWLPVGLLVNMFYSLYANFDTEFSGVHAAWAALRGDQLAQDRRVEDEKNL